MGGRGTWDNRKRRSKGGWPREEGCEEGQRREKGRGRMTEGGGPREDGRGRIAEGGEAMKDVRARSLMGRAPGEQPAAQMPKQVAVKSEK